jgi:hypothetical protein
MLEYVCDKNIYVIVHLQKYKYVQKISEMICLFL